MEWIASFINAFMRLVVNFFKPLIVIAFSITGVISVIIGAFLDPQGAANAFICRIIDLIDVALPRTPDSLKIGTLLTQVNNAVPVVGWGVVLDTFQMALAMLVVVIVIKIYKLIPFKMS